MFASETYIAVSQPKQARISKRRTRKDVGNPTVFPTHSDKHPYPFTFSSCPVASRFGDVAFQLSQADVDTRMSIHCECCAFFLDTETETRKKWSGKCDI